MSDDAQHSFVVRLVGGGLDALHVVVAHVAEAIDAPTAAKVLATTHEEVDLDASLGALVVLEVLVDGEVVRKHHLVVLSVSFEGLTASAVGEGPRLSYTLQLEHPFALVRARRDVRMFQAMDAMEIVEEVLSRSPVDFERQVSVARMLSKRDVCVQYRESDFDFVGRLLQHEGIFFFCDDEGDAPRVVLADGTSAFGVVPKGPFVLIDDRMHGRGIHELSMTTEAVSDQVTVADYDFEKPDLDVSASRAVTDGVVSDRFDFPAGVRSPEEAETIAAIRAEELVARRLVAEGRGDRWELRAGAVFDLVGSRAEGEWLLLSVEHTYSVRPAESGEAPVFYEGSFRCIPKAAPYRPARTSKPPVARGAQSVVVTGPSGEEIHTDDLGRLKAKFFWDREGKGDDRSSFWMRQLQVPISGSMALARVGWEMAVVHLWGDPDRPVAVARLYNGEKVSPYGYPGAAAQMALQTPTSPGGGKSNEVRLSDGDGGQEWFLNASKDYDGTTKNNKTETIGGNESLVVGTEAQTEVKVDQAVTIGGNLDTTVGADEGLIVKVDRTKTVGGSETATIVGNVTEVVEGSDSETVGGSHLTLAAMGVDRTTIGSQSLTVAGSMVSAAGQEVSAAVAGARAETVGGVKIAVAGSSVETSCIGAMAVTIGGVCVQAAGGNFSGGAKTTAITVGGVVLANAAGELSLKAKNITITVGGVANFLGGGGILNLTAGSASFVGLVKLDASSALEIKGNPNLIT